MAIRTFTNINNQTVAMDSYGSWRVYDPTSKKFGAFAKGPVVSTQGEAGTPQPQPAASQVEPAPALQNPVVQSSNCSNWKNNVRAVAAALIMGVGIGILGMSYLGGPKALSEVQVAKIGEAVSAKVSDKLGTDFATIALNSSKLGASQGVTEALGKAMPEDVKIRFNQAFLAVETANNKLTEQNQLLGQLSLKIDALPAQKPAEQAKVEVPPAPQASAATPTEDPDAAPPASGQWKDYRVRARMATAKMLFTTYPPCGGVPPNFVGKRAEETVMRISSQDKLEKQIHGYCDRKAAQVAEQQPEPKQMASVEEDDAQNEPTSAPTKASFFEEEGSRYNRGPARQGSVCPKLGSPHFFQLNPRPQGEGWEMVATVPGKPCGGWRRISVRHY